MNTLRQKWENLSVRERGVLGLGSAGVLLILAYTFLWAPWQESLSQLRVQVPVKQADLAWMQKQGAQIGPLLASRRKTPTDAEPLLTLVEQTAETAQVRDVIRRMSPGEQDKQVKVWLTEADFDNWLGWLEQLRKRGVEVVSATINRSSDDKVTIRVTFQRGA